MMQGLPKIADREAYRRSKFSDSLQCKNPIAAFGQFPDQLNPSSAVDNSCTHLDIYNTLFV